VTLSDTNPAAEKVQLELLRAAGPARRLELTFSMSSSAIQAARRAIAAQNPHLDELDVKLLWAELHYGKDLADKVRERLGRL